MDHPSSDQLQVYVDQRLGDQQRTELDAHLRACPSCATEVASLRQLLNGLESLDELALSPDFAANMAEEAAPSTHLQVPAARRGLMLQAALCSIILLACGILLTIIDTPVTDPSDDVLGMIDVLLGSPFQENASVVAVLGILALAGLAVLACILAASPRARPGDAAPSRVPRHWR